jgi:hypothetical protein
MRCCSYERVAQVLLERPVSDVEAAYLLGCKRSFVAHVRRELRLPAMPLPPMDGKVPPEVRLMLGSVLTSGGHRHWYGRRTRDGVPLIDAHTTAQRLAFRLEHGREAEGNVRVNCRKKHCVEGSHLSDRRMREEARALDAAGGVL